VAVDPTLTVSADTPEAETKPAETQPPDDQGGEAFDKERAMATIQRQRDAEKALKAQLKEAKEKADKFDVLEAEKLSAEEKAQQERDAALAKAQAADAKLQTAHLLVALSDSSLGIVNAKAAAKLIEGVEYDDNGEPTNLGDPADADSLIAKFLADNSFLRGTSTKPTAPKLDGGTGDERPKPALTAAELQAAEDFDMTPEEYAVFKNGGSLSDLTAAGLRTDTT
jgi:hypothetical protein